MFKKLGNVTAVIAIFSFRFIFPLKSSSLISIIYSYSSSSIAISIGVLINIGKSFTFSISCDEEIKLVVPPLLSLETAVNLINLLSLYLLFF